ncbi:MAG: rane protein, partial [Burkholderiales bacterium]|nr:rane protein [Burkholderiales bacterium]
MRSTALRYAILGLVALLLWIPVSMIQGLIAERQQRRDVAVANIASGWGKRQTLAGPYLAVPYERHWTEVVQEWNDGKLRERRTERSESLLLRLPAESVEWRIAAEVSEKAYGIYKARLFSASAHAAGELAIPVRFGLPEDAKYKIKWGTPRLVFGVSDPQGIRSLSALELDGEEHAFEPGSGDAGNLPGGVHVPLAGLRASATQAQTLAFKFNIELAGSEALAVAPLGSNTAVAMRSDWPHPSFIGRFLPLKHEIDSQGFSAEWKVSQYAAPGTAA